LGKELILRSDDEKGKETAKLFRFAMESSGSGPPRGIMTLDDYGGAAAFLRAVKNQLSMETTFCYGSKTIVEYLMDNNMPGDFETLLDRTISKGFEFEQELKICKVSVSPVLLFLHMDQGCFDNTGYTPFASPIANSRSIYLNHVKNICEEVVDGKVEITQEDVAIIPFEVCFDGHDVESSTIPYRCTLNRDVQSDATVMGKKAMGIKKTTVEALNQNVSF
jgi:hypothetical protein